MEALQRARQLYAEGDLRNALEAAQVACERAPKDAEAWWLLGCVARHAGLPRASDQAFSRAAELSRSKAVPVRVSESEFRTLVAGAREELSPDARRRLAATDVRVVPLPHEEEIRAGLKPDATSRRERDPADVLTLYQVNVENRAASASDLRSLVARILARA